MSSYSVQVLTEKLARLSLSQDSIETLSLWVIHHKSKAKTSVATWLEEFKKGDADRRLVLLYLANDVLQNGRRRGAEEFLDLFQDALRVAIPLVRGQKIQENVVRMLLIWKERKVYDNRFLGELDLIIEPSKPKKPSEEEKPVELKLSLLEDALTELRKFEAELKVKSSHLSHLRVDINNPSSSLEQLKDKSDGGRVSMEISDATTKLQDYCECLGVEVNERINILDMLRDTKAFSTHKLNEFKRTMQNYKDLGSRLDSLNDKLQQHVKELERAQSTATSDPTAEDDITVVGDMEIESDGEGPDEPSTSAGQTVTVSTVQTPSTPQVAVTQSAVMSAAPQSVGPHPTIVSTGSQPRVVPAGSQPSVMSVGLQSNIMSAASQAVMMAAAAAPVSSMTSQPVYSNSTYYPPRPPVLTSPHLPPSTSYPPPRYPTSAVPAPRMPPPPPSRPPPFVRPIPPPRPHPPQGPVPSPQPRPPPGAIPSQPRPPPGTIPSQPHPPPGAIPSGPRPPLGSTIPSQPHPPPGLAPPRPRPPPGLTPSPQPRPSFGPPSSVPSPVRSRVSIPPPQPSPAAPPIMPPVRSAPPPAQFTPNPRAMSAISLPAKGSQRVIIGAPVLYKKESPGNADKAESPDSKASHDGKSSQEELAGDDVYSPSDTELYTNFTDDHSEHMSPGSPHVNMNNPILQALYSSPQTSQTQPSPSDNRDKTDTSLHNQNTSMVNPAEPVAMETTVEASEDLNNVSPPQEKVPIDPSQIKITPALTSLLDELLPSLSKTLQVRKRKPDEVDSPSSKQSKVDSDQLGPGTLSSKPEEAFEIVPPWIRDHTSQQPEYRGDFSPRLRPRYPPPRFPRPDFHRPPPPLRYGMRMPHRPRGPPQFSGGRPPGPNHYPPDGFRMPRPPMRDFCQGSPNVHRPDFNRRASYH